MVWNESLQRQEKSWNFFFHELLKIYNSFYACQAKIVSVVRCTPNIMWIWNSKFWRWGTYLYLYIRFAEFADTSGPIVLTKCGRWNTALWQYACVSFVIWLFLSCVAQNSIWRRAINWRLKTAQNQTKVYILDTSSQEQHSVSELIKYDAHTSIMSCNHNIKNCLWKFRIRNNLNSTQRSIHAAILSHSPKLFPVRYLMPSPPYMHCRHSPSFSW